MLHKRWKRARLITVLKKMVDLPPSPALLCELEGQLDKMLGCLHPPQAWMLGADGHQWQVSSTPLAGPPHSPRGEKENQGVTHGNDMAVPPSFAPSLRVPAKDGVLCAKTELS